MKNDEPLIFPIAAADRPKKIMIARYSPPYMVSQV